MSVETAKHAHHLAARNEMAQRRFRNSNPLTLFQGEDASLRSDDFIECPTGSFFVRQVLYSGTHCTKNAYLLEDYL